MFVGIGWTAVSVDDDREVNEVIARLPKRRRKQATAESRRTVSLYSKEFICFIPWPSARLWPLTRTPATLLHAASTLVLIVQAIVVCGEVRTHLCSVPGRFLTNTSK